MDACSLDASKLLRDCLSCTMTGPAQEIYTSQYPFEFADSAL